MFRAIEFHAAPTHGIAVSLPVRMPHFKPQAIRWVSLRRVVEFAGGKPDILDIAK